jgi:hypothetical protein
MKMIPTLGQEMIIGGKKAPLPSVKKGEGKKGKD